ncbi:MAG: type II secretion system GspH family protein [Gaiellaceae bacterium]|nr:type II secretion system GspH family protein [Gaiellaceae bacterium]
MAAAHWLRAASRRLRRAVLRLREEASGIALVELLVALSILAIAIAAQLGVFASSMVSLRVAGMRGTAVTVADIQIEMYRRLPYQCIYLTSASGDATYTSDSAYSASQVTGSTCAPYASPPSTATTPSRTVVGPDGRQYRVDTYIVSQTPSGGRAVKRVTVVVRELRHGTVGRALARQATIVDQGILLST